MVVVVVVEVLVVVVVIIVVVTVIPVAVLRKNSRGSSAKHGDNTTDGDEVVSVYTTMRCFFAAHGRRC